MLQDTVFGPAASQLYNLDAPDGSFLKSVGFILCIRLAKIPWKAFGKAGPFGKLEK